MKNFLVLGSRLACASLAGLLLGAVAGCGGASVTPADELNASYLAALERTAPRVADFEPGGGRERQALVRLRDYFARMTADSVRARTAQVYAPDAYLNDNLVYVEGAEQIENYFLHSVGDTDSVEVEFIDVARTDDGYYVRWVMTIRNQRLQGGEALKSLGMTHFCFDADGRVLVHKDFWDAATGLYEHLPLVGGILRFVRARLAQQAGVAQ